MIIGLAVVSFLWLLFIRLRGQAKIDGKSVKKRKEKIPMYMSKELKEKFMEKYRKR